jgi:hypothetical protein
MDIGIKADAVSIGDPASVLSVLVKGEYCIGIFSVSQLR